MTFLKAHLANAQDTTFISRSETVKLKAMQYPRTKELIRLGPQNTMFCSSTDRMWPFHRNMPRYKGKQDTK